MKKIYIFTLLFVVFFIKITPVLASACSYSEQARLNSAVANIKVSYEEKTGQHDPSEFMCQPDDPDCTSEYNYFEISILNLSKDFYITVTNDVDDTEQTFTIDDVVNGAIRFNWEGIMNIATFTFNVYSSSETPCARENYRTIYLTTPRKNPYHYYLQCQNHPDYYLCKKYVTFEDIGFYEFLEQVDTYIEENDKEISAEKQLSSQEKVIGFIKEHIVLVSGVAIGLLSLIVVIVVIKTRKRKKSIL